MVQNKHLIAAKGNGGYNRSAQDKKKLLPLRQPDDQYVMFFNQALSEKAATVSRHTCPVPVREGFLQNYLSKSKKIFMAEILETVNSNQGVKHMANRPDLKYEVSL